MSQLKLNKDNKAESGRMQPGNEGVGIRADFVIAIARAQKRLGKTANDALIALGLYPLRTRDFSGSAAAELRTLRSKVEAVFWHAKNPRIELRRVLKLAIKADARAWEVISRSGGKLLLGFTPEHLFGVLEQMRFVTYYLEISVQLYCGQLGGAGKC